MIVNIYGTIQNPSYIEVKKEDSDKRPKNESNFYYMLTKALKEAWPNMKPWAKIRSYDRHDGSFVQAIPGLNSIPYSVRNGSAKSKDAYLIYDNYYMIRDIVKDFWAGHEIYLHVFYPHREEEE